jgi:hypothetical protein
VIKGPIAREYQPSQEIKRLQLASPDGGYRIHLHRREDRRPLELDPGNFEFGFPLGGSSLIELNDWLLAVAPEVPVDDAFRRLPPALGPAEPTTAGVTAPASLLPRSGRGLFGSDEAPALLDNVGQFRFYSGWRAAVERRRLP